ncbi:hypothetical protein CGCVW01_v009672 [Colletotrichum viniferum]|nr:hypothetical protein CGCVW01_v009672 [Colletotrichum viniferum]
MDDDTHARDLTSGHARKILSNSNLMHSRRCRRTRHERCKSVGSKGFQIVRLPKILRWHRRETSNISRHRQGPKTRLRISTAPSSTSPS